MVTSRLVVQVWKVDIPSGTIINSQTFLIKKNERFETGTCLITSHHFMSVIAGANRQLKF